MRKALISMGYRELKSGIWGKPVGFNMFSFNINTKEWINHFKGLNNTNQIYNTCFINDENDFLGELKASEFNNTKLFMNNSNYEFIRYQDIMEL